MASDSQILAQTTHGRMETTVMRKISIFLIFLLHMFHAVYRNLTGSTCMPRTVRKQV